MIVVVNEGKKEFMNRAGFATILYLTAVFCSIFLPIPELGITSSVLNEVYPNRGSGIWELEPERAIAVVAAYFFLLGLSEIFVFGPKSKNSLIVNKIICH